MGMNIDGSFYITGVARIEVEKVIGGLGRIRVRVKDATGQTGFSFVAWGIDLASPEFVVSEVADTSLLTEKEPEDDQKHATTD